MYLSRNLRIVNLLKRTLCVRRQKRKGKKYSTCKLGRRGVCILTNLAHFSSSASTAYLLLETEVNEFVWTKLVSICSIGMIF